MSKITTLVVILFWTLSSIAQAPYDVKNPGTESAVKCKACLNVLSSLPREVQYGFQRDDKDMIYFIMTDKVWFNKLFSKPNDGVAVDIICKDQYVCGGTNNFVPGNVYKGSMLKPVYKDELLRRALKSDDEGISIPLGYVPDEFKTKDIEFNLIIINDNYSCHYTTFFDVKVYSWELLDMGMYMDTVMYKAHTNSKDNSGSVLSLTNKQLVFTIPFLKNKSEYSPNDIKPLYDSLKLTDFNITKMDIRAYSSIEGSEKNNIELQEKRSASIQKALQTFQGPAIQTTIQATENWVEFFNDIEGTPYANLSKASKPAIKDMFKDPKKLEALEPILKKHRKAVVIIELEKKSTVKDLSPEALKTEFGRALTSKNMKRIYEIQENVFQRISEQKLPSTYIGELGIPKIKDFVELNNRNLAFNFLNNIGDETELLRSLQELNTLDPKNGHVRYNMCVLKFKKWLSGDKNFNPVTFQKDIDNLKFYGIDNSLIKRMMINYNIIQGEFYMRSKDYPNKDKCLIFINNNYKQIPFNPVDMLNIAQYFSSYAKYDWAIKLLTPYVSKIDADEDLLYYYLNLTLVDENLTKTTEYRKIMLNAINLNKSRFCKLFSAFGTGGITFQMLQNDFLKDTYCENCK